jgi:hypothetical protein
MKCCFSRAWLFRGDRNFFDAFNSLERNSKGTVSAKFKLLIPMFYLVLSSANVPMPTPVLQLTPGSIAYGTMWVGKQDN